MNKKGLSDVITNVLIIVLVIVAVTIIAAFVMPLLNRTTSQANEGTACLSVNVAPVSCVYDSVFAMNLSINRGSGTYDIKSVNLILDKNDGSVKLFPLSATSLAKLTEFATVREDSIATSVTEASTKTPTSFSVAVLLSGNRGSCPQTSEVVCARA